MPSSPPESPHLPAQHFRMALRTLDASSDLVENLLRGTGIKPADLANPEITLPVPAIWPLCDNMTRLFGEAWFLDMPVLWSVDVHSEFGMALRFAPNFGTAIDVICEFGHVRWPVMRATRSADRLGHILTFIPIIKTSRQNWCMATCLASLSFQTTAKAILSSGSETIRYHLGGEAPAYADRLAALFDGNISWGHDQAAILVPKNLSDQVSPLVSGASFAAMLATLRNLATQQGHSEALAVRVSQTLDGITDGRIDAGEAARKIGISRRTLERHLAQEGTSFRRVQNESIKKRLETLLTDPRLTGEAIAERLGYHDTSSLLRACRRLYGTSMAQVRRNIRAMRSN